MTLRKQTFSGVRWTTFSAIGRSLLQITQLSILARLLTPNDFGLIAVVSSIMAFLQIFADAGISNAIIHYQDISKDQLNSLYWLNVGVSTCLALFILLLSHWIAIWYAQPQLKLLLTLTSCSLVMGALAQQIVFVAQKNLRFPKLAKIELLAACIGFVSTITTAYNGFGVYSIVIGTLTTSTIGSILVWCLLADGWVPRFRFSFHEIRHFLLFGFYMIGNNLANIINSQIDIVLGGKILGVQSIGLYSMPRDLSLRIAGVVNPIVTRVGLPVMAKAQSNKELLKRVYLQTMRMTASVNFPIYVAMAFFASGIVRFLLGPKWELAIPLMRILAVWALVRSTANPIGSLLMACGRADLSFKWNVVLLLIMPLVLLISCNYGVLGMALAMMSLMILLYWPNWFFQVRPLCGASFREYSVELAVPLTLSILSGFSGFFGALIFGDDLLRLISGLIFFLLTYLVLSWRYNQPWVRAITELAGLKLLLLEKKSFS